jgi:succinate dehydrogenase flavin-adding protein (antitoxin of CptAB toxin-antitoxin module)
VQQDAFRRLLACPDPLIHDYLLGRLPAPDPALAALIERMTDPPSSAAG